MANMIRCAFGNMLRAPSYKRTCMPRYVNDMCAILAPAQTTELPDPTFIKQIEEAFKEYPEEKLDALCAMKTRVCVAIVENWGEMTSVCVTGKSRPKSTLTCVKAFSYSPDVASTGVYSLSLDSAAPHLHVN